MLEQNVKVIKNLQKEGLSPEEISQRLQVSLPVVNEALEIIQNQKEEKTARVQTGYFKALVAREKDHYENLKGTSKFLVLQVGSLWDMVHMLEEKRKYLEGCIEGMEKYIKKGSRVADVFIEQGVELEEEKKEANISETEKEHFFALLKAAVNTPPKK